jgi:3-oxoadipate enol-lactonase
MPLMTASDGCSIYYRFDGDEGSPVVMLSNSLGSTHEMWEPQMATLTERYRVLRYDNRGHGQSSVPEGPYSIERIATDAQELIAELELGSVLWCGVSMGGMVGMWLGANAPHVLRRAVLANTSALIGPPEIWNQRIALMEEQGMEALAASVLPRWITAPYAAAHPEVARRLQSMIASISPKGYAATAAAIRDMDLREILPRVSVPVLVIAGSQDPSTPCSMGEQIASAIPGARFAILDAAHLSNIEQADEFNRLLRKFFDAA